MEPFFFGLIVGIITSAPIGPVGLLTIQRTLAHGRLAGVLSGAGAATADAFYAGLADLSLSVVSNFLASARFWIHLGAGILCLWFGGRAFFFRPRRGAPAHRYGRGPGVLWTFVSSLLLTLANPLTILFFIVVFTTLQMDHSSLPRLLSLVAGIFSGCLLWWIALSLVTARLHTHLESRTLILINRVSAIFIIILGVVALGSAGHFLVSPRIPKP